MFPTSGPRLKGVLTVWDVVFSKSDRSRELVSFHMVFKGRKLLNESGTLARALERATNETKEY